MRNQTRHPRALSSTSKDDKNTDACRKFLVIKSWKVIPGTKKSAYPKKNTVELFECLLPNKSFEKSIVTPTVSVTMKLFACKNVAEMNEIISLTAHNSSAKDTAHRHQNTLAKNEFADRVYWIIFKYLHLIIIISIRLIEPVSFEKRFSPSTALRLC